MWKKDENGNLVVVDGNPMVVTADGKEEVFSLDSNKQYIESLKNELIDNRKSGLKYKDQLQAFDGIDPAQAREAIEKLGKIDAKVLIDAGKVDEVKAEMQKAYEAKLNDEKSRSEKLEAQLKQYIVGNEFGKSKFIADKLNIPVDMVQNTFGKYFAVDEQNRIIALHDPSNKDSIIYSEANPGEPASFDEALAKFINAYPHKDSILKGSGNQGSGTSSGEYSAGKKWSDYTESERVQLAKTNPSAFQNLLKTKGD